MTEEGKSYIIKPWQCDHKEFHLGRDFFPERLDITMVITKETIIGDLLDKEPGCAKFFFAIGMHCLGCPSARGESIEQACAVHGTDADELIAKINDFLSTK